MRTIEGNSVEAGDMTTMIITNIRKTDNDKELNPFKECDSETNPSQLYTLLQKSEWRLCEMRAKTFVDEVQRWIVKRDQTTNELKWRILPLHASILFHAPTNVIKAIIQAYPQGVKEKDDKGMLPLHVAFLVSHLDTEMVSALLDIYPEAVLEKDNQGRAPISMLNVRQAGSNTIVPNETMKAYSNASVIAKERIAENAREKRSADTEGTPVDESTENSEEKRDTTPANVVAGTVVGADSAFSTALYMAELRSQAEEHESEIKRIEKEHLEEQKKIHEAHEKTIQSLNKAWELKMASQKEQMKIEMKQVQEVHKEDIRKLRKENDKAMDALREALKNDDLKELNKILKEEVGDLKKRLEKETNQANMYKTLLDGMKKQQAQMSSHIREMAQDHDDIIQMVMQQRTEMETSYAVKDKIINSLLQQEDDDRLRQIQEGDELLDLVEESRERMEKVLKRFPMSTGSVAGSVANGGSSIAASFAAGLTSIREEVQISRGLDERRAASEDDDMSALTDNSGH